MNIKPFLYAGLCALTATTCSSEEETVTASADNYLNVTSLTGNQWHYISLASGRVVGTSPLGSVQEDSAWAQRLDWDLALCGSLIRTNSGTSGQGRGGLKKMTGTSYEGIETPSDGTFDTDVNRPR